MHTNRVRRWTTSHRIFMFAATFALLLIVIIFGMVVVRAPGSSDEKAGPSSGEVSLTGTLVCLPHKDMSGPQTLECATGLKSGDEYYALKDKTPGQAQLTNAPFNKLVTVSGTLHRENDEIYRVSGTLFVTSISQEE